MHSVGLYPLILKPTKITYHSASLIDYIINHLNVDMTSGLIVEDISDYLPIFLVYKLKNMNQSK